MSDNLNETYTSKNEPQASLSEQDDRVYKHEQDAVSSSNSQENAYEHSLPSVGDQEESALSEQLQEDGPKTEQTVRGNDIVAPPEGKGEKTTRKLKSSERVDENAAGNDALQLRRRQQQGSTEERRNFSNGATEQGAASASSGASLEMDDEVERIEELTDLSMAVSYHYSLITNETLQNMSEPEDEADAETLRQQNAQLRDMVAKSQEAFKEMTETIRFINNSNREIIDRRDDDMEALVEDKNSLMRRLLAMRDKTQ